MLAKATEKYCFDVEPCASPDGLIVEDGRLVGLRFRRTKIENGRVVPTDETFERRGTWVISSIGSIPEPINGIPTKGELFDFADWDVGHIEGFPTLFSVGNVVTGKGNIVASRKHAARVSETAIEGFLGLGNRNAEADVESATAGAARATADAVASQLAEPPSAETLAEILRKVEKRQQAVGYTNYKAWIAENAAS